MINNYEENQNAWDNLEPEGDDDLNSSEPVDDVAWDDEPDDDYHFDGDNWP
jgi:hypothetical protein